MEINLITSNLGKVKEFKAILGDSIKINHMNIDYKELRSDDPEEIAKDAAKILADELKKPIVVEDSGLFIKALKDFPGTCSAYIHKRIGLKGILKLMENINDRTCCYKSAVSYCEPGKEPVSFLGKEEGTIAKEEKGNNGFGHDPIFIPEGSNKTYGETENCENLKRFRKIAVEKLKKHLKKED
jgi:XTP/dITP diphosphohydrolase|tara:strand:- start:8822 stop:9373 length:552 start_codon:yes stop_codon:yes gene_type:complete